MAFTSDRDGDAGDLHDARRRQPPDQPDASNAAFDAAPDWQPLDNDNHHKNRDE